MMVSTSRIFYKISCRPDDYEKWGRLTIVAPTLIANSVSTMLILPALESFYPIHRDGCARLTLFPNIS